MSRRILLADDSVTIQKVIDLTFSEKGFEVAAASDGLAAIALLSTFNPDLVITDVHMPGASGFDVCRRSKELFPAVPVMLLVGTFEPFEESEASAAGADTFVKKPFDDQELLRIAADLLAKSAPPASQAAAAEPVFETAPAAPFEAPPLPAYPEIEEEVDLDTWDKLEIATETSDEIAPEPVWGNFDDALSAVAEETPAPQPFHFELPKPEPEAWIPESPASEDRAALATSAVSSETVLFDIPALRPPVAPPAPEPELPAVAPLAAAIPVPSPVSSDSFSLSDADVERIARRVAALISEKTVRDIAWEIIPDVAELVVRDRLKELEAEVEATSAV